MAKAKAKAKWEYKKTESGATARLKPQDVIVTYSRKTDSFTVDIRPPVTRVEIPSAVLSALIWG